MRNSGDATLGILGGMGPLATAEFVRTIYEFNLAPTDQGMPRIFLDCDPGLPDRTEAIRANGASELAGLLDYRLRRLCEVGSTKIVIACVTVHHFLPQVDAALRARVLSLVAVAASALAAAPGRFLMLATQGARESGVFEREPGWQLVADRVVPLAPPDQDLVHRLVYRIKRLDATPDEVIAVVDRLRERYGCSGVVLGCTEFHLFSRELAARLGAANVVDPLRSIAAGLPGYLSSTTGREAQLCL